MSRTGSPGRLEGVDVLVQGEGVRRQVPLEVDDGGLRFGEMDLPYRSIYWTSRRAGLLMIFAADRTLAVKGSRDALDELARRLERGRGRRRSGLPASLAEEVIVCTAGTAVVGRIAGREASGLRVAVLTRRGLHLLDGREELRLGWPVDAARVVEHPGSGPREEALLLEKDGEPIRLLYLFPEELQSAVRLATTEPEGERLGDGPARLRLELDERRPVEEGSVDEASVDEASGEPGRGRGRADGSRSAGGGQADAPEAGADADAPDARDGGRPPRGSGDGESLELFARREVAGPVQPELPPFRLSVSALQEKAEAAIGRIAREPVRKAGLGPHFLETHFLELGEVALGPLLLRKSAATSAGSFVRVVEAMDGEELQEDTRAAVSNAANRLIEVYGEQLDRLVSAKRAPARVEEEYRLEMEEEEEIRLRLQSPFERLIPVLRELEERQEELRDRLREVEEGPPGADDPDLGDVGERWKRTMRRVEHEFEDALDDLLDELVEVWDGRLLPRLADVGTMRRRRVPEWVRLALLAGVTLLAAATAMILLVW